MKFRDPRHYLNVNPLIERYDTRFVKKDECIILKNTMYGVTGSVKHVEGSQNQIKVLINEADLKESIYHPFIGQQAL